MESTATKERRAEQGGGAPLIDIGNISLVFRNSLDPDKRQQ